MAWERWQEWYEILVNQKYRLQGALNRMRNRKLSMAWEQWQYFYELMKPKPAPKVREKTDVDLRWGNVGTNTWRHKNTRWARRQVVHPQHWTAEERDSSPPRQRHGRSPAMVMQMAS